MHSHLVGQKSDRKGFTLLELLIVIAIIAILSVMLIIVINPIETLRKSRDSQRISDLNTLKTAMGIYTTSIANPVLDGGTNSACKPGPSWSGSSKLWYSYPSDTATISNISFTGTSTLPSVAQVAKANISRVDGTGWIPVNFDSLPSGSPISNMPIDPVNSVAAAAAPKNTDLVYRYACGATNLTYEVDARLESNEYTSINNRMAADGGDNDNLYEVGTSLLILGNGNF